MSIRYMPVLALSVSSLLLAACQSTGAGPDRDDGYFTWVDEQGRVRQSVIPRESLEEAVSMTPVASSATATPTRERSAEAGVDGSSGGSTASRTDAEFNLENYPDGNELAEAGFVRPGDPMPYFTWLDAAGNVRVSYFTPDTRTDVEKGLISPPVRLTPASTYQPDPDGAAPDAPEANADTLAILGVEQGGLSWFEQWRKACCDNLAPSSPQAWEEDREFSVSIDKNAPRHGFSTGESAYRLVRLPAAGKRKDLVVRLRSFAVDGELFVPSLAFLDGALNPVRVVTDIAHQFVPESWHRQAYLQAWIPAFPEQGERWILIFTREQDLKGQTVVEGRYRPVVYQHEQAGLMSVEAVTLD
jgi:hypothetical protein